MPARYPRRFGQLSNESFSTCGRTLPTRAGLPRRGRIASRSVDALLAVVAASAATAFFVDLVRSYRRRPRRHVAVWATAVAMYGLATWALAVGVVAGWSDPVFRVFYLFGAILNVPFLALGSIYLAAPGMGRRLLDFFVVLGLLAAFIVVTAPTVAAIPADGLPAGSEVFAPFTEVGPTGPRFWALIANVLGTLVLVSLGVVSIIRLRNRTAMLANALVIAGVLAPVYGGTLFALGEAGTFAASLLLGAVLLWSGFRVGQTSAT